MGLGVFELVSWLGDERRSENRKLEETRTQKLKNFKTQKLKKETNVLLGIL